MVLMLMGTIIVAVMGAVDVGGVKNVYNKSLNGQRLDFFGLAKALTSYRFHHEIFSLTGSPGIPRFVTHSGTL